MFENPTVNLNALCSSCAKFACFSSELIFTFFLMQAATSKMRANSSSGVSTFILLTSFFIQRHKKI